MTSDPESASDDAFRGLMASLNLDAAQFKTYRTDFGQLDYGELAHTKTEIEAQLATLFDVLRRYGADMATPLVSADGFPRSDIDVVGVRLVRVRVIRLRNDHAAVLQLLELKMAEEFARRKQQTQEEEEEDEQPLQVIQEQQQQQQPRYTVPFAVVRDVAADGPAYALGLRDGDRVVEFGGIHAANHANLARVVAVVQASVGSDVGVVVARDGETKALRLRPAAWSGPGVLGCRLVPL